MARRSELPDDWYELERPHVSEGGGPREPAGHITLTFTDPLARAWWRGWLESKAGYEAFGDWVDARR